MLCWCSESAQYISIHEVNEGYFVKILKATWFFPTIHTKALLWHSPPTRYSCSIEKLKIYASPMILRNVCSTSCLTIQSCHVPETKRNILYTFIIIYIFYKKCRKNAPYRMNNFITNWNKKDITFATQCLNNEETIFLNVYKIHSYILWYIYFYLYLYLKIPRLLLLSAWVLKLRARRLETGSLFC